MVRVRFILTALAVSVLAWRTAGAVDDAVTVVPTSSDSSKSQKNTADDSTPVVHKSSHRKKTAVATTVGTTPDAPAVTKPAATATPTAISKPSVAVGPTSTQTSTFPSTIIVSKNPPAMPPPAPGITATANGIPLSSTANAAPSGPAIETGLPQGRYSGIGAPIKGVSTYVPPTSAGVVPAGRSPYFASNVGTSVVPLTSAAAGSFTNPSRTTASTDFTFVNFPKDRSTTYPWKNRITTTVFWIGEGSTPISSTTNVESSWDQDWLSKNHGSDSPNNRDGYAAGNHASMLNPFYVALPFNDLAFPDKARRWLPGNWYRRPVDGKQVSACKDRWIEIKNARGDVCYAQWEDVGPLTYDDAEYVFGGSSPVGLGNNRAGLDVSPAVAECLGLSDRNRYTSWRFVDDRDVRPGPWLKLDEQAVLYTALHQLKVTKPNALPLQKASEPIDDPSKTDANKKKIGAAKG